MQSFNFKSHRIEFYAYLKMFILFYKSLIFSKESDKMHWSRTDGRAVECTGLENRRLFTEFVSSNLTPSAIQKSPRFAGIFCTRRFALQLDSDPSEQDVKHIVGTGNISRLQ